MKTGETGGVSGKGDKAHYMKGMSDGRSHMGKADTHGPLPTETGEGPKKVGGWVDSLNRKQKRA